MLFGSDCNNNVLGDVPGIKRGDTVGITLLLFTRGLGADDAPFGPVMGKRGEAGTAAGMGTIGAGSSSIGVTTVAAVASETPRRWARAVRERAGASPRVRSAASNTGNRTWIH